MKVKDAMLAAPRSCQRTTSLAQAGRLMADVGCGMLPVLDADRRVVGVITDRDIGLYLTRTDERASEIPVELVMTTPPRMTAGEAELSSALETMGRWKVRRLPVVTLDGELAGVLSLDDVMLVAPDLSQELIGERRLSAQLLHTLQQICSHELPVAS